MSTSLDVLGGVADGVGYKAPVAVATTADLTNTMIGLQVIDGYQLQPNDRVLVWKNADQTTNGVWIAQSGAWFRAIDFCNTSAVYAGTQVMVFHGASFGGFSFALQESSVVFGVTNITFKINNVRIG